MKTLAERLQWAIDQAGIKKTELARACGVTRGAVSQWFNGGTLSLEGSNLTNAAKATGINPHWLATGTGSRKNDTEYAAIINVAPGPEIVAYVPLISWVQAGKFCESPGSLQKEDAEDWIPSIKRFGPNVYALRVVGDSMLSTYPGQRSYPAGSLIFVDPDTSVTNGCRVVARIHDNDTATFKVYSEDAGKKYLKPLNTQYPTVQMDESMHICGVVVGIWIDE